MSTRAKYEIDLDCNTVTVTWTCPYTNETLCHRYWVPPTGGYVRADAKNRWGRFDRPGSLGWQPTDNNGCTWTATDVADLARQVRATVRAQRRNAQHQ